MKSRKCSKGYVVGAGEGAEVEANPASLHGPNLPGTTLRRVSTRLDVPADS